MGKRFRPSLLPSLIVIGMLAVLVSLGTWQLNRAEEKQKLVDSYRAAPQQSAISLSDVMQVDMQGADIARYRYRLLELQGRFDNEHHVLLDNQLRDRRPGVMVFTPFKVRDSNLVVMVNRGWLEKPIRDLRTLDILADDQAVTLSGIVNHAPDVGIRLGSLDQSKDQWPRLMPYLDMHWLANKLDVRLASWVLLLNPDAEYGYVREWEPTVRTTPKKHQGYAFQWYSLAIALIFLFVVGSLRPEGRLPEDSEDGK